MKRFKLVALVIGTVSAVAPAAELSLRAGAGAAVPVSSPQTGYFAPGPGVSVAGALQLFEALDVEVEAQWLWLPPSSPSPTGQQGGALGVTAGARLKRPLTDALVVPWISGRLGVLSSAVPCLALTSSAGVHFRLSGTSPLLLGPVVQLTALFGLGEVAEHQTLSAAVVSVGLSIELAPRTEPLPQEVAVANPVDSDGDGLADDVDRCPNEAEDLDGFEDEDGCPELDNDGDGIADAHDACPNDKGAAAAGGCPDEDGDGIADRLDECPHKAGAAADHGCPTYKEVVVTATRLELKQRLFFAFGTTSILPKSFPLLTEVTQAMEDHHALCVRVEGHTDSVGSADSNLKLSDGRAGAVQEFLVTHGIDRTRVMAKGYGAALPLDSNGSAESREHNRRVEFVIVPCEAPAALR